MTCKLRKKGITSKLGYFRREETHLADSEGRVDLNHSGNIDRWSMSVQADRGMPSSYEVETFPFQGVLSSRLWNKNTAVTVSYEHRCTITCKARRRKSRDWSEKMSIILRILAHLGVAWTIVATHLAPLWALLFPLVADLVFSRAVKTYKARKEAYEKDLVTAEIVFDNEGTSRKEAKKRTKHFVKELKKLGFYVRKSNNNLIRYEGKADLFELNAFAEPLLVSTITSELNPFTEADPGLKVVAEPVPDVEKAYPVEPGVVISFDDEDDYDDTLLAIELPEADDNWLDNRASRLNEVRCNVEIPLVGHSSELLEEVSRPNDGIRNFMLAMESVVDLEEEPTEDWKDILPERILAKTTAGKMLPGTIGFTNPWSIEKNLNDGKLYIAKHARVFPTEGANAKVMVIRTMEGKCVIDVSDMDYEPNFSPFRLNTANFIAVDQYIN